MTPSWQESVFPNLSLGQDLSSENLQRAGQQVHLSNPHSELIFKVLTFLRSVTCIFPFLDIPTPPAMPTSGPHAILPDLLLGSPNRTPATPLLCLSHLPCWGPSDLLE